jgi:prolyl-tRNA synthetase
VAVLLRGDRKLNEVKLCNFLGCNHLQLADEAQVRKTTGAPTGFSGPIGLSCRVLADQDVAIMSDFGLGANEENFHLTGANYGRDFQVEAFVDLREAVAGDDCPRCTGKLEIWRGIEVGHVFKLGTKYSETMNATVLDDQGKERTLVMGCYGIGIGRTAAAAIEQNHDGDGIIWPMPLAPFQVIVTMLNPNDESVFTAGEKLYQDLLDEGVEVLLDDRDERPGSKFKDADLLGIPLRVNVGARSLKEQSFELQERRSGERIMLPIEGAAATIAEQVRTALAVG